MGSAVAVLCSLYELLLGKAFASQGNWPRVAHVHTAYGPPLNTDTDVFTLYCHNLQFSFFFFSSSLPGFSNTPRIFLLSAIPHFIAGSNTGNGDFFFSSTSQTWSYTSASCHVPTVSCKGISLAKEPLDELQTSLGFLSGKCPLLALRHFNVFFFFYGSLRNKNISL